MPIKRTIRKLVRRCGWDLKRYNVQTSEWAQLARQLAFHSVTTVFDVGANTGQYARNLRDAGYKGRIISFEPLSTAHSQLVRTAQSDSAWIVAPRVALGDRNYTSTLNVAGNSFSSSLLPMLPAHLNAAPESRYITTETVSVRTLDSMAGDFLKASDVVFIKLDVQGYEYRVLQGAASVLPRIAGLQMELSLVPLYAGDQLFEPMLGFAAQREFDLWGLVPGFADGMNGRVLQADVVFFRSPNRVAVRYAS